MIEYDEQTTGRSLSKKSIQNIYGTSFTDGNEVTLVWKDRESFQGIFNAIREAQEFICLQFYIYRDDETGKETFRYPEKEGRGRYFRLCHLRSLWFFLHAALFLAGIEGQRGSDQGIPSLPVDHAFHYVHRDHRKLIIIDGTRALPGHQYCQRISGLSPPEEKNRVEGHRHIP